MAPARDVSDNDSVEDSDEENEAPAPPKRSSTGPRKATPSPPKQTKAKRPAARKKGQQSQRKSGGTTKQSTKSKSNMLTNLSKKVLNPDETPETSLIAALLASSKPMEGFESSTSTLSVYTPQLEGIARKYLQEDDTNILHCHLLNLLFRSVGGRYDTIFDPTTTDLEELDDDEWTDIITNIVDSMRDTDPNAILLQAKGPTKPAMIEYQTIYEEFWSSLGRVLLQKDNSSSNSSSDQFSSSRFQVEQLREIVTRVAELAPVGQPDLRAAATVAVMKLADACLERTIELEGKITNATRQVGAAQKAGNVRKLEALQLSLESWKRHKLELEELVEGPILQGVFMHRYRDSSEFIRSYSVQSLSELTLARPDMFLTDKYLKYMGWLCSDKEASVRVASLKGLHAPFKAAIEQAKDGDQTLPSLKVDLSKMENVCHKFVGRIVDCVIDVSSEVQEAAMVLLLSMLKNGNLDDAEAMNDAAWDQVNLVALDDSTSPEVRKNALYFVLEQMDCFDPEGDEERTKKLSERKQMERIEGIALWYV
jgi:cohesin complex subunit SA-1/2